MEAPVSLTPANAPASAAELMAGFHTDHGEEPPEPNYWLSTGIPILDYALRDGPGGGIPSGRITEIYGLEGSCKSSLMEHVYADTYVNQRGAVVDIDKERTRNVKLLGRLGVKLSDIVYEPLEGKGLAAGLTFIEEVLTRMLGARFPSVIGLDTISALRPEVELDAKIGQTEGVPWGVVPKLMAQVLPKLQDLLHPANAALIIINQLKLTEKTGYTGSYTVENTTAGKQLRFYASNRIQTKVVGLLRDVLGNVTGMKIKFTILKNKIVGPWREVVVPVYMTGAHTGYDPIAGVLLTLMEYNMIGTHGAYRYVTTRNHRISFYLREEYRFDYWHYIVQQNPGLLDEAMKLIWDPEAPQIVRPDLVKPLRVAGVAGIAA